MDKIELDWAKKAGLVSLHVNNVIIGHISGIDEITREYGSLYLKSKGREVADLMDMSVKDRNGGETLKL